MRAARPPLHPPPLVRAALALGLALGLAACRRPPLLDEIVPGSPDEGRQLYLRACSACHGLDGRGGGPVAPSLVAAPADLSRLAERHGGVFPRELVIAVVSGERPIGAHGTREMPVWTLRFRPKDGAAAAAAFYARRRLELLADHLETLQRGAPP